ncbi:hypothetical protein RFI_20809, partial [Reticulomyxa filosa]
MFEQLQKTFPKISEEIISDALNWLKGDIQKTKTVLTWLIENTTNLQQQHHLMELFKDFGTKFEKTTISQTWENCNQIYADTFEKLKEICDTRSLNELNNINKYKTNMVKEENELKILREICLHILWNIFKYPKHIKYRQINKQALYNNLKVKCHSLGAHLEKVFVDMENQLQYYGFKKGYDNNWYYQHNRIQISHLWNCYQTMINLQILYKTRVDIPTRAYMLLNEKWKDYLILFDYQHRTIMLFNENKLKIRSLQVGNPKNSSLEFNVHIQLYNDIDIDQAHAKWACLILNHTWRFRTVNHFDREYLANCCSVNNFTPKNFSNKFLF